MISYFNITDSYHISGSLFQVARTKTVTYDHLITFIALSIHGSASVNRKQN